MSEPQKIVSPSLDDQFKRNNLKVDATQNTPASQVLVDDPNKGKTPEEITLDLQNQIAALKAENETLTKNPKVVERILTPEEIQAKKDSDDKALLQFVVVDKNIKATEWERFQKYKSVSDRDYVFEKYKAEMLAEDPSAQDNDIQIAFEGEYGLNQSSASAIQRVERRIALEASKGKAEEFKQFEGIDDEFKAVSFAKVKGPVYEKMVNELPSETFLDVTPEGFKEPVEIKVDFSDILEQIKSDLKSPVFFSQFNQEDVDTAKSIDAYVGEQIRLKKFDVILKEAVEAAYKIKMKDIKQGSIAPVETTPGSKTEKTIPAGYEGITKQFEKNNIKVNKSE